MKAFIHIGPPKTGTTSIQVAMRRNAGRLERLGIMPGPASGSAHRELLTTSLWAAGIQEHRAFHLAGLPGPGARERAANRYRRVLEEFFDRGRGRARAAVFSIEGLFFADPAAIRALAAILGETVDEVRITFYLRRQDLRALSRYRNLVRNLGVSQPDPFSVPGEPACYHDALAAWEHAFGRESLVPCIFPDSAAHSFDLLRDFFGALELSTAQQAQLALDAPARNLAWDARSLAFMQRVNRLRELGRAEAPEADLKILRTALDRAFRGRRVSARPPRAVARAFFLSFAEDNEAVRRRWYPHLRTLFNDDFSMYPEQAPEPASDLELVETALEVLRILRERDADATAGPGGLAGASTAGDAR